MLLHEDLLTVAQRNVEQARELVYRQRAVVRNLKQAGLDTQINEDVLRMFERSLGKCQGELDRLSTKGPVGITRLMDPKIESEQ